MFEGFTLAGDIAERILRLTKETWRALPNGPRSEPVEHAWRRQFGEELTGQIPILFLPTFYQDRMLSIVLYRRGRVLVEDPLSGRTIRVIDHDAVARDEAGNIADSLAAYHPTAAWIQRERPDGYGSYTSRRVQLAAEAMALVEAANDSEPHPFLGERIVALCEDVRALNAEESDPEADTEHIDAHHAKVGGSAQEFLRLGAG